MEKNFDDMTPDEKVVYLMDGLNTILFNISLEARRSLRPLGFTPEKSKEYPLLAMIEGMHFSQHDTSGAMDWLSYLRITLADDYNVEGLYEDDEDEESQEDEESDELEEVEA